MGMKLKFDCDTCEDTTAVLAPDSDKQLERRACPDCSEGLSDEVRERIRKIMVKAAEPKTRAMV